MEMERMAKMTESIVAEERVEVSPSDDEALSNVDQAFDAILAAISVINDNLPNVKTDTVPEKAARDAMADIMETAIEPYFADMLKAMQTFETKEG